jgi:hypothetical protein
VRPIVAQAAVQTMIDGVLERAIGAVAAPAVAATRASRRAQPPTPVS